MKKLELKIMWMMFKEIADKKMTGTPRFLYTIAMNKRLIANHIESIVELERPIQEFEEKRIEMCKKHCLKDELGNPVMHEENGEQVFSGLIDNKDFQADFEIWRKNILDIHKNIHDVLNEEVSPEIEFEKMKVSDCPEGLSLSQMEILMNFIKE